MLKILIALSTFNRKNITKLCLENLKNIVNKDGNSKLVIYDDASTNYGVEFLKQYSNDVLRFRTSGGVERSRARSFRDFIFVYKDFDLFYMTDNDTIHDPKFLEILRNLYKSSSENLTKGFRLDFIIVSFTMIQRILFMKIVFFRSGKHVRVLANVLIAK